MTWKIAGLTLCAAALLFGPVSTIGATNPQTPTLTAEDGTTPYPPPSIPPALAAVASADTIDGTTPYPPPSIPPVLAA